MNKYLVILAGSPRGGQKTYESLIKNVCDYLPADLAVCTSIDMLDESLLIFQKADYKWILDIQNNFFEYYEKNFSGNWKEYFEKGKGTGLYESGIIHFAFKDFILKNYLNILEEYEYIIYTRFDQFYLKPHVEGSPNRILIPSGEDYFGVCDRHAVIPINFVEKFLNICNFIDSKEALDFNSDYLNCETAYLQHLKHEGLFEYIYRYPRFQFTAAEKNDKTNWRVPKYKIYLFKNLWIKYPDEFIDSCKFILQNTKIYKFIFNFPVISFNYFYLISRRFIGNVKRLDF